MRSILEEKRLSEAAQRLLLTHAHLLERWRGAMNLVGPGPIEPHYCDALRAFEGFVPEPGRWADLGTGAGFPGIVFTALFPQLPIDLVDSRRKRCRFLEEVLAASQWQSATVRCARHESLLAGAYAGIFARALHPPDRMVEVGRRLLRPGGTLVLFLQRSTPVPDAADLRLIHVRAYTVGDRARSMVALRVG